MRVTRCTSCGAPIVWAETPSRAPIPVDPKPREDGLLVLSLRPGEAPLALYRRIEQPERGNPLRYQPHFASCPQARLWGGKSRREHRAEEEDLDDLDDLEDDVEDFG